jgi:SAM-dependent methyltransferase
MRELFADVHSDLPRQGPGNRASTERALAMAGALPADVRILDIACGPGMQTLDLADLLPKATIVAVDMRSDFADEGRRRAAERGVSDRVEFAQGDMRALAFPPASFDLIWCEGAAYIMGVENALGSWRKLLSPGGRIALSDAVWLRDGAPRHLQDWWAEGYPDMRDVEGRRDLVRACGYQWLGDFVLPVEAWWEHYYNPMADRLNRLELKYAGDSEAKSVLQGCRHEIANYRAHAAWYGYVFLVMKA